MQSGEDSLWESFPQTLQSCEGAGRYINAFRAPFQELPPLSSQEVYALRACSLLVIPPPPPGRVTPQGGFPTDLMEINLLDWASLVQDVAAGMQVLPPGLSNCLDPEVITLLQWLEAVSQVRFCHLCYHLDTNCRCAGVPPLTPLTSWSQITERTPGYGMTASSVWGDYSEYLLGGYDWTSVTSTRDFHLGTHFRGRPLYLSSWSQPVIQTSHWEGQMAKGCSEHEGSGATGSSECTSQPPAASRLHSPGANQQPHTSR